MGILPQETDYGSREESPNHDYISSADSGHFGRLPVHEESTEWGADAHRNRDTDAFSIKTSSLWEKVKAMAWILPVVYTHFWLAAVISLLAPYFPPLASSRGVPAWKYGFVFSAVKLSMLPGSVLAEKLIANVSPRVGYLSGQASVFLFSILFGTLYWIQNGDTLLVLAITCIGFGGCMYTTYSICLYSLLSNRFHEDGGILIGIMECLWGFGTLMGSIIGGALIDLWAYPLPFYVIAVLLILSFPAMAVIDPKSSTPKVSPLYNGCKLCKYKLLLLFRMKRTCVLSDLYSSTAPKHNRKTKKDHRTQFQDTRSSSFFYISKFGFNILTKTFYKKKKRNTSLTSSNKVALIHGFFVVVLNLFFIYLAQVFMGLGMSLMYICPYMHALRDVVERAGYPDTLKTNGVVSSATYEFMVLGAVITSPLAGYLVEKYGFRQGSMFMFWLLAFWTVVTFLVWVQSECSLFRRKGEGDRQLLINDTERSLSRCLPPSPSST
ncbi:unnamed protein product [Ixodes hexagonus]